MSKIPLSLGDSADSSGDTGNTAGAQFNAAAQAAQQGQASEKKPVMGWMGVGFGLLGIFISAFFVPVGLIFSIIALFVGQAVWGVAGIILAVFGVLTSPILLTFIGMGAVYATFDFDAWLKPFLDFLNSIGLGDTTEV